MVERDVRLGEGRGVGGEDIEDEGGVDADVARVALLQLWGLGEELSIAVVGSGDPLRGAGRRDVRDEVLRDGGQVGDKIREPSRIGRGFELAYVQDEELEEMLERLLGAVKDGLEEAQAVEHVRGPDVNDRGDARLESLVTVKGFT